MREKLLLKPDDVHARYSFAKKHGARAASAWVNCPHAIIDNKHFSLHLDRQSREYVARRIVRGAYRSGSSAVQGHLVKPKGQLKYPAPGVQVTAGVIKGRVRFWRVVEGRWNSVKAVEMYKALEKAMAKAFPDHAARRRAKWIILEDNDPSGYKSTVAQATKVGAPAGRSELEAINQTMQAKSLSQRWVTEDTQCASQNLGRSGAK